MKVSQLLLYCCKETTAKATHETKYLIGSSLIVSESLFMVMVVGFEAGGRQAIAPEQ